MNNLKWDNKYAFHYSWIFKKMVKIKSNKTKKY